MASLQGATRLAGRALPRVGGAGVGLALVGTDGVTSVVGTVVLVLSVMTSPTRWWRYVTTGERPLRPVRPEFAEHGGMDVVLQSAGPRPIEVLTALRQVSEPDFAAARALLERAPVTVVRRLSETSAGLVRKRLEAAGATVTVVPGRPD
ncbi:MAG TPA: ribosomal protein L7/L12 [Marmoricola sp.]|nr:ribosomal protein L7/L12 [Marmoricola sp.]